MAVDERLEIPFFELDLDPDHLRGSTVKRAEIRIGDPLQFKCNLKNFELDDNPPTLSWNFNGAPISLSDKDKLIDIKQRSSTLKIARFEPLHQGQYECSAKLKTGVKKLAKLKVDIKPENTTTFMFDEELCSSNYSSHCYHGGICLVHKPTNTISCRCPKEYVGPKCEYAENFVDKITKADPNNVNAITVGCVISLALILSFSAFMVFLKTKYRKISSSSSSRKPYITDVELKEIKTTTLLPQVMVFPAAAMTNDRRAAESSSKEERIYFMPKLCSRCSRDMRAYQEFCSGSSSEPEHALTSLISSDRNAPIMTPSTGSNRRSRSNDDLLLKNGEKISKKSTLARFNVFSSAPGNVLNAQELNDSSNPKKIRRLGVSDDALIGSPDPSNKRQLNNKIGDNEELIKQKTDFLANCRDQPTKQIPRSHQYSKFPEFVDENEER